MPIKQADTLDYLSHHGIKGQKWGVRHGPPYPLTAQAKAKAYPKNSKSGSRYGGDGDGKSSTAKKIAVTVATAYVATIATAVIKQSIDSKVYKKKWKDHREDNAKKLEKDRKNEQIDPKTGLYLKKKDLGIDDDLKKVNQSYEDGEPFKSNCTMCTAAMEMRRRGYDVAACGLVDSNRGGLPTDTFTNWFKPPTKHTEYNLSTDLGPDQRSKMYKKVAAQGDGARGEILVTWSELGGGHSMFYQVEKGNMVVYDGQNGKKYKGKEIDTILDSCCTAEIRRLDKLTPNMDAMKSEKNKPLC